LLFQGCPADNELSRKLETRRKHELLPLTASAIIMRKRLESDVHLAAEVLEVRPKWQRSAQSWQVYLICNHGCARAGFPSPTLEANASSPCMLLYISVIQSRGLNQQPVAVSQESLHQKWMCYDIFLEYA